MRPNFQVFNLALFKFVLFEEPRHLAFLDIQLSTDGFAAHCEAFLFQFESFLKFVGTGMRACARSALRVATTERRHLTVVGATLFGLSPHDPLLLAVVSTLLLIVSLAASFIPALQAARTDPMKALRHE
jgi:ABC-type antimicrobial peptide transport system permease subunit